MQRHVKEDPDEQQQKSSRIRLMPNLATAMPFPVVKSQNASRQAFGRFYSVTTAAVL
jgi:hypothetical protein